MLYKVGKLTALEELGLLSPKVKARLLKSLEGPLGPTMVHTPINSAIGAGIGYGSGYASESDNPWRNALFGAGTGAGTALIGGLEPALLRKTITALK